MSYTEQLDAYGLPMTEPAAKGSRLAWERRWTGVLLDHPYNPPGLYAGNFAQFMGHNLASRGLLHGTGTLRVDHWRDYAARWEKAGVSPELFALILALLPSAIEDALRQAVDLEVEYRLHDRLRCLNADGGQWGMKGENLVPEQWADFPYLFQKLGPKRALSRFITTHCGPAPH